jgi:hypothetical protein
MPEIHNGKTKIFLIKDVGETGYPHTEEWNWTPLSHQMQESTQNG